jgi:hypothetical protein
LPPPPTRGRGQQVQQGGGGNGPYPSSQTDYPSQNFKTLNNALLRIDYPDNWQAYGQGDVATIAPRGGLVDDGQGNQALAVGAIVNVYQPHSDAYGSQLQPRGYGEDPRQGQQGQGSSQNSLSVLQQDTDQLVSELRLSNRNMRVVRYHQRIRVENLMALSTYLSNDSPAPRGGRETDWLITMERPEGLLFIVFTAPEREFRNYEPVFQQMLDSVRVNP